MDNSKEHQLLLEIVETWQPSEYPEYRGFRCANCQQYKNQAWYHCEIPEIICLLKSPKST